MIWDFLLVATSRVGVEQLFNSAQDIYYFYWGHLSENTIYTLMLQLIIDYFMIKKEYNHMREENKSLEEVVEEQEDELFLYISDTDSENEDRSEIKMEQEEAATGSIEDDGDCQSVQRPHQAQR